MEKSYLSLNYEDLVVYVFLSWNQTQVLSVMSQLCKPVAHHHGPANMKWLTQPVY